MNDLGEPVGSIEEEMDRLKKKILPDIDNVGADLLKKTEEAKDSDATKRAKALKLLYPLCKNPMQVEALDKKVNGGPNTPPMSAKDLDTLLQEAVQRRILTDILWPIEMFRPSEPERLTLERAADLDMKTDKLRELLTRRLEAAGKDKFDGSVHYGKDWDGVPTGTIEKRQNAAFLLVSIACARKHLDNKGGFEADLLYPKGLERAQRISGLFDFTQACINYNDAVQQLEARVVEAIALDREGFRIQKGADVKRSEGFADKHAELIFRIRQRQLEIRQAQERITDLQQQYDRMAALVKDRSKHTGEIVERIKEERIITTKVNEDLQRRQRELFRALEVLADVAERNEKLEREIRVKSGLEAQP
jgi:hypothetical protein